MFELITHDTELKIRLVLRTQVIIDVASSTRKELIDLSHYRNEFSKHIILPKITFRKNHLGYIFQLRYNHRLSNKNTLKKSNRFQFLGT